jgi:four helix bundle protein
MQNAKNLRITASARVLAGHVYRATATFPRAEQFGLTAQMRRAAVSVGSNISEGCGRSGSREFMHFLHIALGSASELEFQALIASELGLLGDDVAVGLLDDVEHMKLMLVRFIKALRARSSTS